LWAVSRLPCRSAKCNNRIINCFEFTYDGGLLDAAFDMAKYENDASALMEIFAPPPE
jgi:hypothetical protein